VFQFDYADRGDHDALGRTGRDPRQQAADRLPASLGTDQDA
jgi:hypothetical protein